MKTRNSQRAYPDILAARFKPHPLKAGHSRLPGSMDVPGSSTQLKLRPGVDAQGSDLDGIWAFGAELPSAFAIRQLLRRT